MKRNDELARPLDFGDNIETSIFVGFTVQWRLGVVNLFKIALAGLFLGFFAAPLRAQVDEICGETGAVPWMNSSFVFGRINLIGFEGVKRLPKITVTLSERNGNEQRYTIDRSGNFCFRGVRANGGFLVVDMEGLEVGRQLLPTGMINEHRQDFSVINNNPVVSKPPSSISAKFAYKRTDVNEKTFQAAIAAERKKDTATAQKLYEGLVGDDPNDFYAWNRLGGLYFDRSELDKASAALERSISAAPEFVPSLLDLGRVRMLQKRFPDAIELLKKASSLEQGTPLAHRLLGEAYLLNRQGSLGVASLNEALRLDPKGMAECHLMIAKLYDAAGDRMRASREYRLFLAKVPDFKEREILERYIKENPEETPLK